MKSGNDGYALDANVILRFLLKDELPLAERAQAIFAAIERGEITAYLDPVILAEVVWVLKSYYKMPPAEIAADLLALINSEHIILADQESYAAALRMYAEGAAHFGDACACVLANRQCAGRLLSFDRKLDRVPGIKRGEKVPDRL